MSEDCLFCSIASGEADAELVYESEDVVAFEDVNPQAPVHLLVIPREHVATVNDLESKHEPVLGRMFTVARELAGEMGFADDGYRLVMNCGEKAGQSVFHIHLHVLSGRKFSWPPG